MRTQRPHRSQTGTAVRASRPRARWAADSRRRQPTRPPPSPGQTCSPGTPLSVCRCRCRCLCLSLCRSVALSLCRSVALSLCLVVYMYFLCALASPSPCLSPCSCSLCLCVCHTRDRCICDCSYAVTERWAQDLPGDIWPPPLQHRALPPPAAALAARCAAALPAGGHCVYVHAANEPVAISQAGRRSRRPIRRMSEAGRWRRAIRVRSAARGSKFPATHGSYRTNKYSRTGTHVPPVGIPTQ